MPHPPVRYIATIPHVREVALTLAAEGDYWREHLARENLTPFIENGQAELAIAAVALRWKGMSFREMPITVTVSDAPDGSTRDGVLLLVAYNSSRLLAFMERSFFATPYWPGKVDLAVEPAVRFSLADQLEASLTAAQPARQWDENWQPAIYLHRRSPHSRRQRFFARLSGVTESYPFSAADTFALRPDDAFPVLQMLVDSRARGQSWLVRRDAVHARSKTFAW